MKIIPITLFLLILSSCNYTGKTSQNKDVITFFNGSKLVYRGAYDGFDFFTKETMLVFDGCTLASRGKDDNGYNLYVLQIDSTVASDGIMMHTWYKDTSDYKIIEKDSVQFDTAKVLSILSTASRYGICKIHPGKNHLIWICLQESGEDEEISFSLR